MIVILFDEDRDVIYCACVINLNDAKSDCQRWIDDRSNSWSFSGDWHDTYWLNEWFYSERAVEFSDPDGTSKYVFEIYSAD